MFDRIKRIFKKNKSNEVGIVTLDNIVSVPNRKDLNDDKKTIEKIDKYKTDYLKILTNKNTLTSHKLGEYNYVSEKVRMYTDIYASISLDEEELFEYTISNKDELVLRKVDIKNKLLKINLYLNDLEKLEKEIILHLIALKEIRNEKVFFSGLRKRILDEEINTLMMSLINVISQKRAISIDTSTALKKHELLNILNDEVDNEEAELINSNYECLKRLTNKLKINNNGNNIKTNNKLILNAQMDKSIEEYAYNNKLNKDEIMIDILKEQLNNLKDKLSKSNNPESYMSLVKYYERKCIKYKKEGLITEEEMTLLYELKFYILTSDINSKDRINIREISTADEFEYYKKIMENILKVVFVRFDKELREEHEKETYWTPYTNGFLENLYEKIHKDANEYYVDLGYSNLGYSKQRYYKPIDYTRFKYYEILGDKEILSLILCLYKNFDGFTDSKNTLEKFYGTKESSNNKIKKAIPDNITLIFDKSIPIITEYRLSKLKEYHNKDYKRDDLYYLCYKLFSHKFSRNLDGLREIGITNREYEDISEYSWDNMNIIKQLFCDEVGVPTKEGTNQAVSINLPKTLKKIDGPLFSNLDISKIVFNDGIEELSNCVFKYTMIDNLIIPSSLKKIDASVFACTDVFKNIIINDADKLQLDDDSLYNLLAPLLSIKMKSKDVNEKLVTLAFRNDTSLILKTHYERVKIGPSEIHLDLTIDNNSIFYEYLRNPEETKKYFKEEIIKYFRELIKDKLLTYSLIRTVIW